MKTAPTTQGKKHLLAAIVLACSLVFSLGFLAQTTSAPDKAYADNSTNLRIAQTDTHNTTLSTAEVKKHYPSKQKMTMTMAGGDTTTLGTKKAKSKVKWTTSNKKIVTVKSTGKTTAKVTAIKPGKATVTAKIGKQELVCKITVTGMLSESKVTITPFETKKIKLKGAKVKNWKTANNKIAKVSKGVITPVATGTTTITCTDKKGYKYRCTVTVICPDITCKIDPLKEDINNGKTYYRKFFYLTNACGKDIVLNDNRIYYYPNGLGSTQYCLYGFDVIANSYFDNNPVTVGGNKQTRIFLGYDNDRSDWTDTGAFTLYFKVGSVQYRSSFHNKGSMIGCWRVAA